MMVNCLKFSFFMTIYASYAILLAQGERVIRRPGFRERDNVQHQLTEREGYRFDQNDDYDGILRRDTVRMPACDNSDSDSNENAHRRELSDRLDRDRQVDDLSDRRRDSIRGDEKRQIETLLPRNERNSEQREPSREARYGAFERNERRQQHSGERHEFEMEERSVEHRRDEVNLNELSRHIDESRDRDDRQTGARDDRIVRDRRVELEFDEGERRVENDRFDDERRVDGERRSLKGLIRDDETELRLRTMSREDDYREDGSNIDENVANIKSNKLYIIASQFVGLIVSFLLVTKPTKGDYYDKIRQLFTIKKIITI